MFIPCLIKIPKVSRAAFPGTLESCCHPGPSFLVARGKSGVPAVQNEQGRKWDIQLTKSASRASFARDSDRFEDSATARPPIDPGPVPSAQKKFALDYEQFFGHLPFFKFPETPKKGADVAKTEISALQRAISTGSRSRRNLKVLPFDSQGDFRHLHVLDGHVTYFKKPIIGNFKIFIPVKYHTKRLPT